MRRKTILKDKNGRRMYFGDIVRVSFHDVDLPPTNIMKGTAVITKSMNGGAAILYDYVDDETPSMAIEAVLNGGIIEDIWDDYDLWDIEIIGRVDRTPGLFIIKNLKYIWKKTRKC